jgi:hypothetical protein
MLAAWARCFNQAHRIAAWMKRVLGTPLSRGGRGIDGVTTTTRIVDEMSCKPHRRDSRADKLRIVARWTTGERHDLRWALRHPDSIWTTVPERRVRVWSGANRPALTRRWLVPCSWFFFRHTQPPLLLAYSHVGCLALQFRNICKTTRVNEATSLWAT